MAQRVTTSYVSDLSGQEIPEDQVITISFGWKKAVYEIDLTAQEAEELDQVMSRYTDAARRLTGPRPYAGQGQKRSGRTPDELAAIRTWARQNGHTVADRGRIAQEIIDAYDAAQAD